MYAMYWLVASLFCRALALPATASLPSSLQDFKPTNIGVILNETVVGDDPPWGPPHFNVEIERTQTPIDRRVFFVTTIQLLASQATLDFNGPLPADIVFSTPQFPDFAITVYLTGPQGPFLRKYIFWAMTRIMQEMVSQDQFTSAFFAVKLRGRILGVITIGKPSSTRNLNGAQQDTPVDVDFEDAEAPPANQTVNKDAVSARNHRLEYKYEHYGEQMTQTAIFMGTIGAMFTVAGGTSHDFESFISCFIQYDFCLVLESKHRPSQFTFGMLVQAIVGAAKYAAAKNEYRELRAEVKLDGRQVAWGGWFKLPPRPPGREQSLTSS
ncbi:MAG: hypothetical protein LQ346_007087 [Caloplaca aetnensis]|nr:MAG: hypothetical protein LQ346_007087 [Caloplaca aetnensis]